MNNLNNNIKEMAKGNQFCKKQDLPLEDGKKFHIFGVKPKEMEKPACHKDKHPR